MNVPVKGYKNYKPFYLTTKICKMSQTQKEIPNSADKTKEPHDTGVSNVEIKNSTKGMKPKLRKSHGRCLK